MRQKKRLLFEERGAILVTTLFFLFCLCGLLSLLLFQEQAGLLIMKTQQTADLITKGARAAGKWEYFDEDGERQQKLFATSREAQRQGAAIIRGAREEAEILWRLNEPSLRNEAEQVVAIHQKGEQRYLYRQGIYHLQLEVTSLLQLFWETTRVMVSRASQSGLYKQ
jgi:hypothetical protein